MKPVFSMSVVTAILLLTATASAQGGAPPASSSRRTSDYVEQTLGGDAVVTFGGDALAAPSGGAYGDTIRRPPGITRVGLIRPRMNFVVELVKSVENL